jgi:peptidoglycan hydrolase-like protein with peptidoglycan-binding domain
MLKGNSNDVDAVKAVQLFLTKSGYDTNGIDGVWGQNTETAVDLYLGSSQLLPTPLTLKELGIRAAKFSTRQIFGYNPDSVLQQGLYYEYIGRSWQQTTDSIKATSENL